MCTLDSKWENKKERKKDKTGPRFSHQNENKTKNKSKTKTGKDLTAPRSGRGESLFLIMGRLRERQRHLESPEWT